MTSSNAQRVYGLLNGNQCLIWLHRFALVYGSDTLNPDQTTGNVYYGDQTGVYTKQCSYKYNGYLSILWVISGLTIAVAEGRICKRNTNVIIIESYGESATTQPISLWFNTGTGESPIWNKLNSVIANGTMPYSSSNYNFRERLTEKSGATKIDDCETCPETGDSGCLVCGVASRFKVVTVTFSIATNCCNYATLTPSESTEIGETTYNYGLHNLGINTIPFTNLYVEYKLLCKSILIYVYSKEENSKYSMVYYLDDLGVWNLITEGYKEDIGEYNDL
jgi:hypothetical protein